jgi:hypothetical protein
MTINPTTYGLNDLHDIDLIRGSDDNKAKTVIERIANSVEDTTLRSVLPPSLLVQEISERTTRQG